MNSSRLPAAMTLLAYLAAGLALSVSWAQLRQVLQTQGGLPSGQYISIALPLAILFGSCVLWGRPFYPKALLPNNVSRKTKSLAESARRRFSGSMRKQFPRSSAATLCQRSSR